MFSDLVVLFVVILVLVLPLICIVAWSIRQHRNRALVREQRRSMHREMYGRKGSYSFRSRQLYRPSALRSRKSTIRQRRNSIPGGDIEPTTSI